MCHESDWNLDETNVFAGKETEQKKQVTSCLVAPTRKGKKCLGCWSPTLCTYIYNILLLNKMSSLWSGEAKLLQKFQARAVGATGVKRQRSIGRDLVSEHLYICTYIFRAYSYMYACMHCVSEKPRLKFWSDHLCTCTYALVQVCMYGLCLKQETSAEILFGLFVYMHVRILTSMHVCTVSSQEAWAKVLFCERLYRCLCARVCVYYVCNACLWHVCMRVYLCMCT